VVATCCAPLVQSANPVKTSTHIALEMPTHDRHSSRHAQTGNPAHHSRSPTQYRVSAPRSGAWAACWHNQASLTTELFSMRLLGLTSIIFFCHARIIGRI